MSWHRVKNALRTLFGRPREPEVMVEAYITRAATGKTEHVVLTRGKGVSITPGFGPAKEN